MTVQNIITYAPVRLTQFLDEDWIREQYVAHNFYEPKRPRRYVKRKNIRKYLAQLHYCIDQEISKILYGSGNLEFMAQRPK